MAELTGLGVSEGTGYGPVARMLVTPAPAGADQLDSPAGATARATAALAAVAADLQSRADQAGGTAGEVLEAQSMMASDPSLATEVERLTSTGSAAPEAIAQAFAGYRSTLAAAGGYLAARVADLDDVRDRAVAQCRGVESPTLPDVGTPYILVARDLAPADTAMIDLELVLAIVTEEGGPTSHTAIVARERGIPAVVGCAQAGSLVDGVIVLVDGTTGVVDTDPAPVTHPKRATRTAALRLERPGATSDGHGVQILANVGGAADAAAAAAAGAEGIGLVRTEFLFLNAASAPSVSDQASAYQAIFAEFPGRKVVVRVLDAGADKPLPFLGLSDEPNPALGVRGLRAFQARPDVLDGQLEAIARARAASKAKVWVMAPMIADALDARWFVERARRFDLDQVGAMIEVPAAALTAESLLREVDFVSIGTNDLAQYTLAADRMVGALGRFQDAWHPAVLQLLAMTLGAARAAGKPAGVCGEAAADPLLACVLVGLGADSLSMTRNALAPVADALAAVTLADCSEFAQRVLQAPDAAAARSTQPNGASTSVVGS